MKEKIRLSIGKVILDRSNLLSTLKLHEFAKSSTSIYLSAVRLNDCAIRNQLLLAVLSA